MSQLAGIVEAHPDARSAFISAVAPNLALLPTQARQSWNWRDAALAFALAENAPLSSAGRDPQTSSGAFVMGGWANSRDGSTSDADQLLRACEAGGGRAVALGEAYGLAGYFEPSGAVWLGSDRLGLFPLYYFADARRLLFSTSPALIESHRDFSREFNVRGLVGNLLTMHMVGGQTLRKNVNRLTPGHALVWEPGKGAREVLVQTVVPAEACFGESYAQHLDRFDAAMDAAVRADAVDGTTGLLLSGGLDSRLLAAYLRRAVKSPVHGITLGRSSDLEMQVAGQVARKLNWPQHAVEPDWARFLTVAERHLTHQQLGVGFNDMAFWYAGETAAKHATRVFTGIIGDTTMGGEHISWGFDPKRQTHSFETIFTKINRYGYRPDQIRQLVRPEALGDALDGAMTDLRDQYDSCAGLPFQKVWLFDLLNRNRFHIAALAWEVSAGAWAVPTFGRAGMLDLAANMPADTLLGRRVQIDLLLRHAPDLAALPLDRNSRTNLAPLKYRNGWHRRWDQKVMGKYRRFLRKWHDRRGFESRYYYRVYDLNNPGWQAIRRAAEPHRKVAETILQPEMLRQLLPPPETPIKLGDGIVDAARVKTLLGFLMWAGKNL